MHIAIPVTIALVSAPPLASGKARGQDRQRPRSEDSDGRSLGELLLAETS
jgi:hypothetical protein